MDLTRSQQSPAAKKVVPTLSQEPVLRRMDSTAAPAEAARKTSGYGLPCAKCNLYYPADLEACPTCNSKERVATIAPNLPLKAAQANADPIPDNEALEQEREEFLRQFKSQLYAAHAEVATAPAICNIGEHHSEEPAKAEVCKPCYDHLQEQLDICEAALHMDVKEAAQIVYDAVWADPSDPSKTYSNAATALLGELRKRAGISSLLGPFQSLSH